ncbi:MAG: alkaline phosphatase family protein, partial [Bacillota bacterium]|nr:alkaline phosphatase family protein [Bacillota bacterium]
MKPIRFPDYTHSIMNVSASILRHYGAKTDKATLVQVDEALSACPRNVVLILVDALGEALVDRHLGSDARIVRDRRDSITSVFPSTTVSATTSVLSGKTPLETGWLGWAQWFRTEARTVITFLDVDFYTDAPIGHGVAATMIPYETIYDQIKKAASDVSTVEIFPAFRTPENDTFAKLLSAVKTACDEPGKHFVYAYWDKVDTLAHEFGPGSVEVNAMVRGIDSAYGAFVDSIDDAVVILIADHGQVDVCPIILDDYPDLLALCDRLPSIETRATAFFVKAGQDEAFRTLFNHYFNEYFALYRSADLVANKLFGEGVKHPEFDSFVGDFIAVAIEHYFFA